MIQTAIPEEGNDNEGNACSVTRKLQRTEDTPRKLAREAKIDLSSNWKRPDFSQRSVSTVKKATLSDIFHATFAITSLCINIYVYKLCMYARLHRYRRLGCCTCNCIIQLERSRCEHDGGIYGCPYVRRLSSNKNYDRTLTRSSSKRTARGNARSRLCHFHVSFSFDNEGKKS